MKELMSRLDSWLKTNRPDFYRQLSPGVSESEIDAFEDSLGFKLPQSFKELYMWKNGQSCSDAFQYNREFLDLESVRENRDLSNGCLEGGDFDLANWWHPKWIPFLKHCGGDLLCLDMDGTFGGVPGQILYYYHDSSDRTIQFPSLGNWLDWFVVTLEAGMWEENEYGFQPKDYARVNSIMKQMSPGYPIYKFAG